MAEGLQEEGSFESQHRLRIISVSLFFGGLFVLAVGAGLFFFKNQSSSSGDIQIIATTEGTEKNTENIDKREVVVHVDGAVVSPGVYKLPGGSRVNDAISAAGGMTDEADRSKINLAAKIADGSKVYIPKLGEQLDSSVVGSSIAGQSVSALININTASESELDKLPQVGPVTAQKIVAARPYSSLEDLLSIKVVSKSVFAKIKDLIVY